MPRLPPERVRTLGQQLLRPRRQFAADVLTDLGHLGVVRLVDPPQRQNCRDQPQQDQRGGSLRDGVNRTGSHREGGVDQPVTVTDPIVLFVLQLVGVGHDDADFDLVALAPQLGDFHLELDPLKGIDLVSEPDEFCSDAGVRALNAGFVVLFIGFHQASWPL
ncbi:hypothetical protein E1281_02120 [Actinomadura sp. KC345]|nr:hypothetical protein E1281_02120 [Actinomadura sp. KC345]